MGNRLTNLAVTVVLAAVFAFVLYTLLGHLQRDDAVCEQLADVRAIVEAQPNMPPLPPVPNGCLR